jgi:D-alanine transaminase
MVRLRNSLNGIRIDFPDISGFAEICDRLIKVNQLESEDAGIYLQITRGAAPRVHSLPEGISPTVFIRAFAMPGYTEAMKKGIPVITREDIRWHRCNIKSIALLPNTLLFQEAVEEQAGECFLIRNGFYTEATHSNILMVKKGVLQTHPDSNLILPGVTKSFVIKLCRQLGVKVTEKPIRTADTALYEECFITGTGSEVMPVISIDRTPVGSGEPGPVTRRIQEEFIRITGGEKALQAWGGTGNRR